MDGLLGQPSILVPQSLSARLSSAFDVLATSLLECLPPALPPALPVGNHQAGRASAAWHACLLELRRLRRSLLDSLTPSTTHTRVSSFPLTDVWALWSKASDMERHLHSSGVHTPALPRWDSFSDSPLEWAGHLGFPAEVAADVLTVPGASSVVPPVAPVSWDSLPSSPAPSACLALVQTWIREAERRQAATTNRQCSTARARRLELLRLGDVKAWAKSMRPLNAPHSRFSPDWVRGADGTRRRPAAQADILQGSVQEWGRLLQEPVNFWSHEAVQPFSTSSAPHRGTLNFEVLAYAAAGSPLALVGQAMLHPGPWRLVPVCAADVRYLSPASLRVADWVLSLRGGNWFAARPMPCPGPLFVLLSFCGKPASEITLDHFRWPPADAVMVIREFSPPDTSAVSPTSTAERLSLCARFRHSRPGPSGWKVCYIEAFPPWLQDLYWTAIDLQRLTGIVAPSLQVAVQVHLAKPAGGWRPLSMLEEGLKSIEAPVAARLSNARLGCCLDHPFSHLNRAYAKGVPAAVQVLYLDCLVCEDALRHRRPLLRVPADYEKFFNTLQLPQVDALQQARGFPDSVRRLHQSLFAHSQVLLDTRAGLSSPISVTRGVPQGSVSSPELSRAAQDPILRLRSSDGAAYVTSTGRRVVAAGYVDDIEHYGSGVADLPAALGSRASGVGFAWPKFSAYASDWDEACPPLRASGILENGAVATS